MRFATILAVTAMLTIAACAEKATAPSMTPYPTTGEPISPGRDLRPNEAHP